MTAMEDETECVPICSREFQNTHHTKLLSANLSDLRERGLLCDVTLDCNGTLVTAHRVVLAACSKYFEAMFTSGMWETGKPCIPINNLDTNALTVLVNYAYTGMIYVDELNVQTILETADLLQFESAKSICCDFIKEQLSSDNCLEIFQFADVYHCTDIVLQAQTMFNKNWRTIMCSDTFLSLDIKIFKKLISSEFLHVENEVDVVDMIAHWVSGDCNSEQQNTEALLLSLLDYVRWPFVKPLELKTIQNIACIAGNENAGKLILDLLSPVSFHLPISAMRHSYTSWMYILGGEQSFLREMKSCEFFNFETGQWDFGFSLHGPRTSFSAVTHGEKLYVIGGMRFGGKLKIVECYNHKTGKWRKLAPLKKCQGDVKAAIVDEIVYVAGGSSEGEPACRYVERYDESNNQWNTVANMKSRRRRFGLLSYKSKLYALGGFLDSFGELRACEVYEPEANTWESIASMKTNRCDLGVATLSGYIYVAGGVNSYTGSISTVERYDPNTNTWCMCKPLLHARGGHAMVSYFGRIFSIGGMNSYMEICKDGEWYNEVTDTWSSLPLTTMPRFGAVAVTLPYCKRLKCDDPKNDDEPVDEE